MDEKRMGLKLDIRGTKMEIAGDSDTVKWAMTAFTDFVGANKITEENASAEKKYPRITLGEKTTSAAEDAPKVEKRETGAWWLNLPHKERAIERDSFMGQMIAAEAIRAVGNSVERVKGQTELRMTVKSAVTPEDLRTAIDLKILDKMLAERTEIDVPLDTGGTVTVVCGRVMQDGARFVFKDCWDSAVMNEKNTNEGGYFKSAGRKHVLEDILPHIAPEWRAIFKPRHLVEVIDGEKVEYDDLMWLPSATDVFGPANGRWWADEPDSFQLPIFQRERDRVKECGDEGTYPWWLRSVHATSTTYFCHVCTGGSAYSYGAYYSFGFAPGFDI